MLVWQDGYGSNAIWNIPATQAINVEMPIGVFAFLFGISMDYQVFIISRMREAYDRTGSTETAVVEGIARTGRLVTSAALIMFLAFVAFSATPGTEAKMFATALGGGILIDATIIHGVLAPAAVALLGRWNLWLPAGPPGSYASALRSHTPGSAGRSHASRLVEPSHRGSAPQTARSLEPTPAQERAITLGGRSDDQPTTTAQPRNARGGCSRSTHRDREHRRSHRPPSRPGLRAQAPPQPADHANALRQEISG